MQKKSERLTKRAFLAYVRIATRLAVEDALSSAADRFVAGTRLGLQQIREKLTSLDEQMDVLRDHASKRQDEIDRLREGYDWSILKRFALRLIHTIDGLADRIATYGLDSEVGSRLEEVRLELIFLLESNDIIEWTPEVGKQVREVVARCEVVETRAPEEGEKCGQVLGVLRSGFILDSPHGTARVVRPAQVAIARETD